MEVGGVGVEASVATGECDDGDATMVAIVGSSSACSWDYLRLSCCDEVGAAAAGPCGDDDRQQVVCSVVFRDANLA